MYVLIGIAMMLTAAMLTSFAVSVALSLGWRLLVAIGNRLGPAMESRFWLSIGLAPALSGLAVVTLIAAPAYVLHEPRHSEEQISVALAALAILSGTMLIAAAARCALVIYSAARASGVLRDCSQKISVGLGGVAYEIADESSTSTVVGVVRPTMFFSRAVISALTTAEFDSVLRHEQAHVSGMDNAWKLLLDFACGLSGNPLFARAVRARWTESIELAADAAAVRTSDEALELLSALVKVARLRQSQMTIAQLGCGFLPFADKTNLKRRIQRLERMADGLPCEEGLMLPPALKLTFRCTLLALLAAAAYGTPSAMLWVHSGLERLMK